jgi:Protein of unknown function (DUF2786)
MNNENNNRIKNIISALLAKAKSTTHPEEAEACMAKAIQLMEKHQIELHELGVEDVIGLTEGVQAQAGPPSYKSDVQRALAKLYGARPVIRWTCHKRWTVDICGPESSRLTTVLMTDFVWDEVNKQAAEITKQGLYNKAQAVRHVAKALVSRIHGLINARKDSPVANGSSFSLVVVDATNAFVEGHYNGLSKKITRSRTLSSMAIAAAEKISLHRQVNGTGPLRLK